jgi:hypothetical protein
MEKNQYYSETKPFVKISLLAGIVGLAFAVIGYFVDAKQFYYSYLNAFVFWTTLMLGGLFFTMLHHISGAVWSTVLRRLLESFMITVPIMALFFVPIIFGIHDLYHWSHEDLVSNDVLLQKKSAYLNPTFFIIRTVFYFVIWYLLAKNLHKISLQQDSEIKTDHIKRMRTWSAPGIVLFALTITFAAFDWLMSLDAHWYSTIFGVYIFAGSFLGFTAFLILTGLSLRKKGILENTITTEHYHDLGKFLFAFTIFWGYMAFSQYFLIWYANIPEETIWYQHRWEGSWKYITLLLVFGHFLIPFIGLMPRAAKRNLNYLKLMCMWILLMHFFDLYWIIMPTLSEHGIHFSWMDVVTFIGIGGIFLWYFWFRYLSNALVPINDPQLNNSVTFTN